jgi:hypothetical protein
MNTHLIRLRIKTIRQELESLERLAQCGPSDLENTPDDTAIDQNRFSILSCIGYIGDACRSIRTQLRN